MKTPLILLAFLGTIFSAAAQNLLIPDKSFTFDFETFYTPRSEVTPVPADVEGVDIFSRGQMGFQGGFSYQRRIRRNLALELATDIGFFPLSQKHLLQREYIGGLIDVTSFIQEVSYFGYATANVGLKRFFTINGELLFVGGGMNGTFFQRHNEAHYLYSTRDGRIDPTFLVFQRVFANRGSVLLAGELSFGHYKRLNRALWFYYYLNGTYSPVRPVRGTYEVFGQNETLTGEITKRYVRIGVGVGLYFTKKDKEEDIKNAPLK